MSSPRRTPVTPKLRDGFQVVTAALTGVATFGALAGTGLLAGEMAKSYQDEKADRAEAAARAARESGQLDATARVIEKRRPHRTVVKTTVVDRVSAAGYAAPGQGGTITSRPGGGSTTGGHSGGGTTKSSGGGGSHASAPPPPPPPPRPAPSSGS